MYFLRFEAFKIAYPFTEKTEKLQFVINMYYILFSMPVKSHKYNALSFVLKVKIENDMNNFSLKKSSSVCIHFIAFYLCDNGFS